MSLRAPLSSHLIIRHSMFIDTEAKSTAVDGIVLPLLSRRVQIAWISGSVATYQVRRRDQLRLAVMHLMINPDLSYGAFANWCKFENEIEGIASLANSHG